jgi:hypothetical protein
MQRLIVLALVAAVAMVAALPAGAAPNGKGHELIPAEPFGVHCDDGRTYSVLLTRGLGANGWRVESDEHYILGMFTITTYVDGVEVARDSKTWGVKAGLEPHRCWSSFTDGQGLVVLTEAVSYIVPQGKR